MAVYNPIQHVPISKALATGAYPAIAKMMYFTNGESGIYKYRAYASVAEVGAYLSTEFRCIGDVFIVNTGGTLSSDNSTITGGVNDLYYYKDNTVTPVKLGGSDIATGQYNTTDTSGQPVITIPHGLSGVPSYFNIIARNANANNISRSAIDADGTNLYLTPAYKNDDGSALQYLWEAKL